MGWIARKNIPLRHRPLLRTRLESAGKWSELSAEQQACLADETVGRRSGGTRNKRGAAIKDEPSHNSENEENENKNENENEEKEKEQEQENENKNENEEKEEEKEENENENKNESEEKEKNENKKGARTKKVAKRTLRNIAGAVSAQKKEAKPVVVEEPPASPAVVLSDDEDDVLRRLEERRWTCDEDEHVDDANRENEKHDLRLEAQSGPQPAVPEPEPEPAPQTAPELAPEPAGAASEQKEDEVTTMTIVVATAPALQSSETSSGDLDTVAAPHAEESAMEVDAQPQTTGV